MKNIFKIIKLYYSSQESFKNEAHNAFNKEANNIALSFHDDKTLHSFKKVKPYSFGKRVWKVLEKELLLIIKSYFTTYWNKELNTKDQGQIWGY